MKPRYIIDMDRLEATAKTARANADRLGVHLLMALKSFPLPAAFPAIAPYVEGVTASGLYEARLAAAMGRPVHVHAPAYSDDEIDDICAACGHVVFNSLGQLARFGRRVSEAGASVWLRINPGFSSADCLKYDPCCPDSRFGVMADELAAADPELMSLVEGIHIHALCEGYADDFAEMVERFTAAFGPCLGSIRWLNLGGGEVVDDILLFDMKPALRSIVKADGRVFEGEAKESGRATIFGAVSCLAGDVLGEYSLPAPVDAGDTVVFGGLGSYSFAQLSWFNGIRHPDIVLTSRAQGERTVRTWGIDDYLREFPCSPGPAE